MRVITATQAYQRQSRSRYERGQAPFAASCPQRLRGDQLFNSLAEVLGFDEEAVDAAEGEGNYRAELAGPRGQMNATFGYDPSDAARRSGRLDSAGAVVDERTRGINRALNATEPEHGLGQIARGDRGRSGRGRRAVPALAGSRSRRPTK